MITNHIMAGFKAYRTFAREEMRSGTTRRYPRSSSLRRNLTPAQLCVVRPVLKRIVVCNHDGAHGDEALSIVPMQSAYIDSAARALVAQSIVPMDVASSDNTAGALVVHDGAQAIRSLEFIELNQSRFMHLHMTSGFLI